MITTLIGVYVVDSSGYAAYRASMLPLLEAHGGRFVVDVEVSAVLKSPVQERFNRLFSMEFPSADKMKVFFASPEYLEVRKQYFESSVTSVSSLGRFTPNTEEL